MSHLILKDVDLYSSVKMDIPDVEAFVIYTGTKKVEKIMLTMLSPEYIRKASERTERIKGDISYGRYMGIPEDRIKESIINRYGLSPTYAQKFLDDDTTPEDCRPWAL